MVRGGSEVRGMRSAGRDVLRGCKVGGAGTGPGGGEAPGTVVHRHSLNDSPPPKKKKGLRTMPRTELPRTSGAGLLFPPQRYIYLHMVCRDTQTPLPVRPHAICHSHPLPMDTVADVLRSVASIRCIRIGN